ncbi:MAG TPA: hypothetical protein VGB37_03925 [Candidatus Lokiarchaeia archaeon]
MVKINSKSLIIAIIFGVDSWFWSFFIVGRVFIDFETGDQIKSPNFTFYAILLILNVIISLFFFTIYLWKYERENPIIIDRWALDAIIFGCIISGMRFFLDCLVFGLIFSFNLRLYFWIKSLSGYIYPAIIFEILILAYFIYRKKNDR